MGTEPAPHDACLVGLGLVSELPGGPAVEDLRRFATHNPQTLKWALKRMRLLEENPNVGEPLLEGLTGWRKVTVSDRDWRMVWRLMTDPDSMRVIEIAEVWGDSRGVGR